MQPGPHRASAFELWQPLKGTDERLLSQVFGGFSLPRELVQEPKEVARVCRDPGVHRLGIPLIQFMAVFLIR
jgi:hypothetical protein